MPEPLRYLIAEVRECEHCESWREWIERADIEADCPACKGTGTRTVVTDVEVEPDGERLDFTPALGKHKTNLWREVRDA